MKRRRRRFSPSTIQFCAPTLLRLPIPSARVRTDLYTVACVTCVAPDQVALYVDGRRVDLEALHRVTFTGISAALLRNGSVVCATDADAALTRSRLEDEEDAAREGTPHRGGLLLVHSHRQRLADFRDHARALGLSKYGRASSGASPSLLHRASLLIINNNAAELFKQASYGNSVKPGPHAGDPIEWLRAYGALQMRIRMVLTTNVNLGYFCGELHALAAVHQRTLLRFPWVLAFSGPDVLLTPDGMVNLDRHLASALPLHDPAARRPPASHPAPEVTQGERRRHRQIAFLYDSFVAPRMHFRVSMDVFLFVPRMLLVVPPRQKAHPSARAHNLNSASDGGAVGHGPSESDDASAPVSAWSVASQVCLRETNRIPEVIVAETLLACNVTVARIAKAKSRVTTWLTKLSLEQPPRHSVVWHVHNETARGHWLDGEETLRGIHYEHELRLTSDWEYRHVQLCWRKASVRP